MPVIRLARVPATWRDPTELKKTDMADDLNFNPSRDDFEALLNESMGSGDFAEGTVVKGLVAAIEKDIAIIDVGLKTEGRIPVKEFGVDDAGKPTDRKSVV